MSKNHYPSTVIDTKVFEESVRRCIPSEFFMISGSADSEEAEEIYNAAGKFDLPNPKGKEGGLCTSLFLHSLYNNIHLVVTPQGKPAKPLTCHKLLHSMYGTSQAKGYSPVPQMTASRPLTSNRPFYIVPPGYTGRRRALIIGVNYKGQKGELKAPQNDAHNIQQFLVKNCGFNQEEVMMLVDDGQHNAPTKSNILTCLQQLVHYSQAGDVLFTSFSGHGGQVPDKNGDEGPGGMDSSLMPVDFQEAGQIVDDDILKYFIKGLKKGVHATMLVDACHCGSVGDLPYTLAATDRKHSLERNFNMETHQEALARDKAMYEAEVERKRQKAERQKEREAIRQRRAEEEEREAAAALKAQEGQSHIPFSYKKSNSPITVIQASSPEELKTLAAQMGISGDQMAKLTQQGGIITSAPIMMTPAQAHTIQAPHKKGVLENGTPKVAINQKHRNKTSSRTKTSTASNQKGMAAPASPTKGKSPSRGGVAALRTKFGG
jgi:hypothetical protein